MFVEKLVRYIADRRITLEVCLTSNQQTIPEFKDNLARHPFRHFRRAKLSTSLCTDNRLVSRTTVTDEVMKAIETFSLSPMEVKDLLVYGFKRSFYPGPYTEKRSYVRSVIDYFEELMAGAGFDVRGG
jgi:adenosine deaminase